MITYNEQHFLPYSIPNLLRVCNKIIVLDASTDNSRSILQSFDNVIVYHEEDYNLPTYKDKRQFVLDKAKDLDDTFISIDADELLSDELVAKVRTLDIPYNHGVYCQWRHMVSKNESRNNCINETQGLMWRGDLNFSGRELVHEDKIPVPRKSSSIIYIDEILLHFGTCDQHYVDLKEAFYMLQEVKEGKYLPEINLRYSGGLDIYTKVNAIYNVSDEIFDISTEYYKLYNKIANFYNDYEPKNALHLLNIWWIPGVIECCGVDKSKVLLGNRSKIVLVMMYYQTLDIIKHKEFKRFVNFFLWHLFRREKVLL